MVETIVIFISFLCSMSKERMVDYIKDLVSVVIPTYKRSDMLERAIRSVLNQTYENIEVLVVSDNEPDDIYTEAAKKLIDRIGDSRLKLVTQEKHINGAAARNAGIRASCGEYVAFLDDDDWWEVRKVELQVALIKTLGDDYGGVTCKNKHYCDGELIAALPPIDDSADLCKSIMLRIADLSTDAILLRRQCLDETGYFDETLKRHQEVQLMSFFTRKYKVKLLDMYLVCVDSTKNENQPSPERMEMIKKDFLKAVEPVLLTYAPNVRRNVYTMHQFEIGLLYLRNGNLVRGLIKCMKVLTGFRTLKYAGQYIKKKLITRKNVNERVDADEYNKLIKECS